MIKYKITSKDWEQFQRKFTWAAKRVPENIAATLSDGLLLIERTAKIKYLTGGTPLNVQTNRLRSSVHHAILRSRVPDIIEGVVGTIVFYGKIHELGEAAQAVKAHSRMISKAFGKPIEPMEVIVAAFTRKVPKKPWLEPAVRDNTEKIGDMLEAVGVKLEVKG